MTGGNLEKLFSKLEEFITTKTVVGEAVHIGDVILVPLVDVTIGMGAGGGPVTEKHKENGAAGGGAFGAKMTPSAVVVIVNGTAQLINVKSQDGMSKLIDMVPGILTKFTSLFNKTEENEESGGE